MNESVETGSVLALRSLIPANAMTSTMTRRKSGLTEETEGRERERGRERSERIGEESRLCDRKARQTVEGPEAQDGLCPFSCVAEVF